MGKIGEIPSFWKMIWKVGKGILLAITIYNKTKLLY
jgi:hypothetical protein